MSGPEQSFLAWAVAGSIAMVATAAALIMVRLVIGPSGADRVMALDLLTTSFVAFSGLLAIHHSQAVLIDVAIVFALLSFLSTVALGRYLERRSDQDRESNG